MNCTEQIPQTVDWISTTKDIILIILSAIAIFSSYLQFKQSKRKEWIKDFRSIIAKFISTATTQIDKNEKDYSKEIIEQFSLITLYLEDKNSLHLKLIDDLKILIDDLKDFKEETKNSKDVSITMTNVILTSKKIINKESNRRF